MEHSLNQKESQKQQTVQGIESQNQGIALTMATLKYW
jgi:hypothetical protein